MSNPVNRWRWGWFAFLALWAVAGNSPFFQFTESSNLISDSVYAEPSISHWLGTDALGRDVLSRSLQAGSVSLLTGLGASILSIGTGSILGTFSGYRQRKGFDALRAIADAIASVPPFVLLLGMALVLGRVLSSGVVLLIFVVAFAQWPSVFRIMRNEANRLRQSRFVQASLAMGATPRQVLRSHIFPNLLPVIGSSFAIQFAWAIKVEALLSYFGAGDPTKASWGTMLAEAGSELSRGIWWTSFAAGLPLTGVVLGSYLFMNRTQKRSFNSN